MAFQSLYRKHRPQSFAELVGQDAVSGALRNAVREDRVGHAYLFSGPRGTGKTTTARLLAKALNCAARGDDGEPCNACASCVEITAGTSMDVVELDAASHRGINEMRSLLERVAYRSAGGARKVYIVDEVHMLTKEASTALLKTLEEPPAHVVFVLATTDPQTVLATIRSRTQHFEFTLLPTEQLAAHLAYVATREGVDADPAILAVIARRAGGSARDALSLLDQALAHGDGQLAAGPGAGAPGRHPLRARARPSWRRWPPTTSPTCSSTSTDCWAPGSTPASWPTICSATCGRRSSWPRPGAGPAWRRRRRSGHGSWPRPRVWGTGVVRALERLGEAAVEIRRAPTPAWSSRCALVRLARSDAPGRARVEALTERVAGWNRRSPSCGRHSPTAPRRPASAPGAAGRAPAPGDAAFRAEAGARCAGGRHAAPGGPARRRPLRPRPPPNRLPPRPSRRRRRRHRPARAATDEAPLDLDDVILAWPNTLAGFKPRLKAMAKEAHPVRVEGATVVLGLPAKFQAHHLPSITAEAPTVAAALTGELGRPGPDPRRGRRQPLPHRRSRVGSPGGETTGRPTHGRVDSPLDLVIETFGATVESEIVRE